MPSYVGCYAPGCKVLVADTAVSWCGEEDPDEGCGEAVCDDHACPGPGEIRMCSPCAHPGGGALWTA